MPHILYIIIVQSHFTLLQSNLKITHCIIYLVVPKCVEVRCMQHTLQILPGPGGPPFKSHPIANLFLNSVNFSVWETLSYYENAYQSMRWRTVDQDKSLNCPLAPLLKGQVSILQKKHNCFDVFIVFYKMILEKQDQL